MHNIIITNQITKKYILFGFLTRLFSHSHLVANWKNRFSWAQGLES